MPKHAVIRAAGVVVLRESPAGTGQEVLLVHRPGHDDWSLPKGKVDSGEHVIAAAVRECDEETGFTPILEAPLTSATYSVAGRPKVVHYWKGRVREEEGFTADDEVDEIRWASVDDADALLTYATDGQLVREAVETAPTVPLVILRHAQALKRSDYAGDLDIERPLTGKGRTQSKSLVSILDSFGPLAIHSSAAKRCYDTVKRLAKHQGTNAEREDALTEEGHREHPKAAARRAAALAAEAVPMLICAHRPVLPTIVTAVAESLGIDGLTLDDTWDPKLPPAGFIVIHRRITAKGRMRVVAVERHQLSSD